MSPAIPQNIQTRSHYLKKVAPFMNQNIIKVITGQRRVGKSYLLFQIMNVIREKQAEAQGTVETVVTVEIVVLLNCGTCGNRSNCGNC